MDGDRAAARGGRRVLVDRAERDRPRAGALRARRARPRHDRRRARVRPRAGGVPLRAARRAAAAGLGADDRAPLPLRGGRRAPARGAEGSRTIRRSPASRRRSTARRRTTACTRRCGSTACSDEPRYVAALEELWPYASASPRTATLRALASDTVGGAAPELWEEMTMVRRSQPAGRRGDRGAGLGRARRDPRSGDPGDLARRPRRRPRRRRRRTARVRVEFTPTFLGCPALEVMRDAMADAIRALGAEPEVEVVPRRLVVDRPHHAGRAARSCARSGFAPPAPREAAAPTLVQLQSNAHPLPVLRLDRDAAREHLRPDAVPLAALLRELPAAVRAVQDDLGGRIATSCRGPPDRLGQ